MALALAMKVVAEMVLAKAVGAFSRGKELFLIGPDQDHDQDPSRIRNPGHGHGHNQEKRRPLKV